MHHRGFLFHRSAILNWIVIAFLLSFTGCSKKQLSDLADSVSEKGEQLIRDSKNATDSLVNDPEPETAPTGTLSIEVDSMIDFDQASIRLFTVGDGRPQSLQIATYDMNSDRLSVPSLFLVSSTALETIPLHEGKTVACDLFIAPPRNRPLLRTPAGSSANVTFGSMDFSTGMISGSISPCTLLATDGTSVDCKGGAFRAVIAE